jgi:hypothetical protein
LNHVNRLPQCMAESLMRGTQSFNHVNRLRQCMAESDYVLLLIRVGVPQCMSESDYVLLLDDDAEMSSAILRDLVTCLRTDPRNARTHALLSHTH